MTDEKYEQRKAEDREVLRRLEIEAVEGIFQEMSVPEREELRLVVGERTFTVEEILDEARRGTEYGEDFLKTHAKARLERMRRS